MLIDECEKAGSCEQKSKWECAMKEEIKAWHSNDTMNLVELPECKNVIPNR